MCRILHIKPHACVAAGVDGSGVAAEWHAVRRAPALLSASTPHSTIAAVCVRPRTATPAPPFAKASGIATVVQLPKV